ncbi:hypothetical protein [Ruminococcus flavefaciens]|uniref:hypothetical protein n=1 Tax=Ruminococcus flavefaciens TaxID=1265 RepID=UPI0004638117|nr:hypothetical protein [Ruminococcus flavefaciens]
MREWDEITRDLLRRRDEKIALKKAKMRIVKRTALSAVCLCAAVTAGIGAWKFAPERSKPTNEFDEPTSVSSEQLEVTSAPTVSSIAAGTQPSSDTVTAVSAKKNNISPKYSDHSFCFCTADDLGGHLSFHTKA